MHVTQKALTPEAMGGNLHRCRPPPNAGTYILGSDGDLPLMGALGEICVGGAGVSLGYHKRPDLTAERFVPDPFSATPGARMYRSGDMGRLLPSGENQFHGRRDHQLKIRGYRIELGEIEQTIAACPLVREVAVVAPEDSRGVRTLIAYVTGDNGLDSQALHEFSRQRLIPPMVPSHFTVRSALPRTSSGKIDRRALASLTPAGQTLPCAYTPPRDDRERMLVHIWEDVLGRSPVGVTDDFFAIGGDSILSMQICARAARAGIALSPKQLFEQPTIRGVGAATSPPGVSSDLPGLLRSAGLRGQPTESPIRARFTLLPDVRFADVRVCWALQPHHDAPRLALNGPRRARAGVWAPACFAAVAPVGQRLTRASGGGPCWRCPAQPDIHGSAYWYSWLKRRLNRLLRSSPSPDCRRSRAHHVDDPDRRWTASARAPAGAAACGPRHRVRRRPRPGASLQMGRRRVRLAA